MNQLRGFILAAAAILGLFFSGTTPVLAQGPRLLVMAESGSETPVFTYIVKKIYPHDSRAFTQGLVFEDGTFLEGTGLNGRSGLRRVELETGKIIKEIKLDDRYFGEGLTVWQDKIIQLTWQARTGFVYDKHTFARLGQFEYPTQGWGLTTDGQNLIMSDGSAYLYFLSPETYEQVKKIKVSGPQGPVTRLNELEWVNQEIWANIWQTDTIARIDPLTGRLIGLIDLSGLIEPYKTNATIDVLNGIAYEAQSGRLFVTGKLWPKLFEIELIPK